MTGPLLAPSERLTGSPRQRRDLRQRLNAIRADPALTATHPELSCVRLSDLLTERPRTPGQQLLHDGISAGRDRFATLRLSGDLPPDRIWIGIASSEPGAFGGFHYPDQGYRHWQMAAIITRYGDLTHPGTSTDLAPLAALDIIRAYAHDTLHYGSFRVYQEHPDPAPGEMARIRYGINFRRPDGRTYSAPDRLGATTTRNLGIIMEAATDLEARQIARQAAILAGIAEPPDGTDRYGYRDITGQLTLTDCENIETAPVTGQPAPASAAAFLTRMARFHRATAARYETLLTELAGDSARDLHALIIRSMISGSITPLDRWLSKRHGRAAFARIFKTPSYTRPPAG